MYCCGDKHRKRELDHLCDDEDCSLKTAEHFNTSSLLASVHQRNGIHVRRQRQHPVGSNHTIDRRHKARLRVKGLAVCLHKHDTTVSISVCSAHNHTRFLVGVKYCYCHAPTVLLGKSDFKVAITITCTCTIPFHSC
eukprot:SAG22_NODE_129_length_18679_cov_40.656028_19_plen_137_part_00